MCMLSLQACGIDASTRPPSLTAALRYPLQLWGVTVAMPGIRTVPLISVYRFLTSARYLP
jgi:hypothetical protein